MPAYKLIYFNSKGAAEGIRLMFAYKGVEYKDERIESENWPNLKSNMPRGMLPVLEVDEKKYCQSGAIARYVARELGMYGSTSLESLQIDEAAGATKIIEETFPKFAEFIINRLKANKDGFMVGNQLSLADIAVYRTCEILGDFFGSFVPDYNRFWKSEELEKHTHMIESQPKISEWIQKRPQTNM